MAVISIEVKDNSQAYMREVESIVNKTVVDEGNDLQGVAKQAAPEKTGNLVSHITVRHSAASGAYQSDIESTAIDPVSGNDYVDRMHNGKYNLGKKSKSKQQASSRIGNFRKNVGRQYLQGSGEKAKKGYAEYMMKQVDKVNKKYSK